MSRPPARRAAIYRTPCLIAALSFIGLVGALLADGVWDWIGAGLLAVSLATAAWARLRRR